MEEIIKNYIIFSLFQNEIGGLNSWVKLVSEELSKSNNVTKISFYGLIDRSDDFYLYYGNRVNQVMDTLNLFWYPQSKVNRKLEKFLDLEQEYTIIATHPLLCRMIYNSKLRNDKNTLIYQLHTDKEHILTMNTPYALIQRPSFKKYKDKFDYVTAFSKVEKKYLMSYGYKNILVFPNTIKFDLAKLQKQKFDKKNKILVITRLAQGKNCLPTTKMLIKLKNTLIKYNYQVDLNFAHNEADKASHKQYIEIQNLIIENQATDVIKLYPGTYGNDKAKKLSQAKIMLIYSDFEGMPTTIFEAQSNKVIPISNISTMNIFDLIDNGKNGFIIKDWSDMEKKIEMLVRDEALIEEISKNLLEKADQYNVKNVVANFEAQLLEDKR